MNVNDAAIRALATTTRMIDDLGPRPSGSDQSRRAADALKEDATGFAESAWTEDFSVQPVAFLGWIRLLVALYAISVALLWIGTFWLAAILAGLGLLVMIGQFFFYRETIDRFFPKKIGRNVLAAIEPGDDVRGQLIVSGHHDSAFVFNFMVHQPALYPVRVIGAIASYILMTIASWILMIWQPIAGSDPAWSTIAAAMLTVLFLIVGQLWWYASSRSTPGAGDNLASSAAAWEALRMISEAKAEGDGLQHLRVMAASWDAEEAGLRGARSWVRGAADGRLDLPTWNLNLECLYDAEELFLLTSDINGSMALSADLVATCQRLFAKEGRDVPAKPMAFLTGGTDAAELAKAGAQATSLIGMPWGNNDRGSVYHTPKDLPESVDLLALAEAIRLSLNLARELDGQLAISRAE